VLEVPTSGAGIYLGGTTAAVIEDCVIRDNRCSDGSYGGGVAAADRVTIRNCVISGNSACCTLYTTGGRGGGIRIRDQVTVTDCVIAFNLGHYSGGVGVGPGAPVLRRCRILGNTGRWGGGIGSGSGGSVTVEDCLIANSDAVYGTVYVGGGQMDLTRCTIANNEGETTAGIHVPGASVRVRECIVLDDCGTFDVRALSGSTLDLECTLVNPARVRSANSTVNWLGGTFFADPLFCSSVACPEVTNEGDYGLGASSPCLPPNNSCGVRIGAFDEGCGIVSIEAASWGSIKARYR
jgi:hypothetical protein